MKGKIVSYDPVKGIGKILIKDHGVKIFNINNWIDYETTPSIGLEVEFGMESNEIIDILSANSNNLLLEKLNKKFHYTLPSTLKIKEDVSLDYCLEVFFDKFKKIALKYKDLLEYNRSIPYKKIKRFILTAYNNLLEIDYSINDTKLKETKNSLDEIENHYDVLLNETKNPTYVSLEKLVLTKQQNYKVLKKRFETNKSLITETTKNSNILEIKIKKESKKLETLKQKSKEYKELMEKLKTYKKKYVDLIDMAQNLKEENSLIIKDIQEFEEVYKEIFEKIFKEETTIILNLLKKEMDILAYKFDTILWENAKKSKIIQNFFKEAKIEGSYSTKTFMKYYLKTLSTDKMNEKDIELLEIFNELKIFTKNVIIYDKSINRARDILQKIETIDHDSDVKIFDNLKEFVFYLKDNSSNLDIAIIEIENKNKLIINKVLEILEKLDIKIILFSETIEDKNIIHANELLKKIKSLI